MALTFRDVLISDPVDPICAQILERHGMRVTFAKQWTKEKLLQEIKVSDQRLLFVWVIVYNFYYIFTLISEVVT